MPKYQATLDISRAKALEILEDLATEGHQSRTKLERDADGTLKGWGITVHEGLPKSVKLPSPETVQKVYEAAKAIDAEKQPFGYFILAVTFGAMPLVDGAD